MVELISKHWRDVLEILILWIGIYYILRAFSKTRGARILAGLLLVIVLVSLLAYTLQLDVLTWIVTRVLFGLALAMVIIFQPELRSALARLGTSPLLMRFAFNETEQLNFLQSLSDAAVKLSKKRFGALIAIERSISLEEQNETGVMIRGQFSSELAMSIFHPKSALHDGGMIIAQNKVWSAGCVFPVSQKEMSDRTMGLRHRAAIGLSEETDAVTIIVSEETGRISVAIEGTLQRAKDGDELIALLEDALNITHDDDETDNEELVPEAPVTSDGDRDLVSH